MTDSEGLGLPKRHYLLVVVPKPRRSGLEPDPADAIMRATMGQNKNCYDNFRWNMPSELRVGTMDALYTLLDELTKQDTYIESVLRKIGRQRLDLTKKDQRKEIRFMINQNGMYPPLFNFDGGSIGPETIVVQMASVSVFGF